MMRITGHDRPHTFLLPESLDDHVGAESPVRFIEAFVDGLDLAAAGVAGVHSKVASRPGYAPADLLKFYIYGYLNRTRSSRRLEAETHRNIELIWLLRHRKPDFKTIANVRRDNRRTFSAVFRRFVLLCKQLDPARVLSRGLDGSGRFREVTNASRRNDLTPPTAPLMAPGCPH